METSQRSSLNPTMAKAPRRTSSWIRTATLVGAILFIAAAVFFIAEGLVSTGDQRSRLIAGACELGAAVALFASWLWMGRSTRGKE